MDSNKIFTCKICIKVYSSYKSLWNHNNKFHNVYSSPQRSPNVNLSSPNVNANLIQKKSDIINYSCKYCSNNYSNRQNRWKHEQNCKKNKIELLEIKNKELEETINKLKAKNHPKTLNKINNQLNNYNIINNTYVKFGDLDYDKILNSSQIKQILNKQYKCLEESIKQIHFNDNFPEYNNIFITNMKDDIAYIFDGNNFISVRKNEMLNELIDFHTKEINLSLEKNKNKLNEKYVSRIEDFINKLNDDHTKFTDHDNQRIYSSYKAYKTNSIKLLIYNESNKKKLELLNTMELKEKIYDELE